MTTDLHRRVDAALTAFLDERRDQVETLDPAALPLVDEVRRLVDAGGKRIRPAFCYWGYRAAGGEDDEPIVWVAAALELLHTMALVHDDLIDGAKERRGVPSTAAWFSERASELGAPGDPRDFGASMAILVGDVSAVWADGLLLASGFAPDVLVPALLVYHDMRERMAVGQSMDVGGAANDPGAGRRAAALKGGSYTVEGPLLIGAALAGGSPGAKGCLSRYGRPLGEAFQLRDDLEDGEEAPGVTAETVNRLVAEAKESLDPMHLTPESIEPLGSLADRVAM
ncbi:MAG TPA: polyprenyl synthetase family protein [Actinomycetota bacterium]|nr:polyprenyl synthetase family protein [Actinomycetota bacterium]